MELEGTTALHLTDDEIVLVGELILEELNRIERLKFSFLDPYKAGYRAILDKILKIAPNR